MAAHAAEECTEFELQFDAVGSGAPHRVLSDVAAQSAHQMLEALKAGGTVVSSTRAAAGL